MSRKCIIIANSNNLSGFLNNYAEAGVVRKLRIDYGQLLDMASENRECLGALIVSQTDLSHGLLTENKRTQASKFLYNLKAFGWTPLEANINSKEETGMDSLVSSVYNTVCSILLDEDGNNKYSLDEVDFVFINGAAIWKAVIQPFAEANLNIEILYPVESTASILKKSYNCYDLTPFLMESNRQVMSKKLSVLETHLN